ncbi:MAG: putative repeat protein (TIGR03806 family), partial [Bradymonadia bacterium]
FGPDGYLYASFGDGGGGGDFFNHGQNPNSVYGTLLRLDVDSRSLGEYGVPADNPFIGGGGDSRVYAWGLRNVWKFSFDSLNGNLWAADVGENAWEEVNIVESGGNYGWPVYEGFNCFNFDADCGELIADDPVLEYGHDQGFSITGGYVYRGEAIPELYGRYIFADFSSGRFFVGADGEDGALATATLLDGGVTPSVFGERADGELFVADYVSGIIYRLDRDSALGTPDLPERLSETGCMNPDDPSLPGPGLIPYAPNAPFWSDGAEKHRWLAIPDGEVVTVDDRGDFEFPLGTVLVKDFRLDERIIETRLFMLHPDGVWAGYSYRWNDAQTEAFLLRDGETREVGDQTWIYPSRTECNGCHTGVAGRSLGLEVLQLNGEFAYPTGVVANQMMTLIDIGVVDFEEALGAWPALVSPHGDAPLEDRARSYLHTNCSSCHQAGGPGRGEQDYHYLAPSMNACFSEPQVGGLGLDNPQVIAPRSPARSVLFERMSRRDSAGMPPIGSSVVDEAGVALIADFILSDFCGSESQPELCDDGADNNGDGRVDCLDIACTNEEGCGGGGTLTCSTPGLLVVGETRLGDTTGGENLHGGSCGTAPAGSGPEAVFEFIAPSTGIFCVSTGGSSFDTYLHVRDACNAPATELGCNDNIVSDDLQSETEISVLIDQSVWVVVDGYDGAGSFRVEVFPGGC